MTAVAGPSGGVLGQAQGWPQEMAERHPGLVKAAVQSGRHPRAGHDRARWETVRWEDYHACVGIGGRAGPWHVTMGETKPGDITQWVAEAEHLPWQPGWHTELVHDDRGLVMSDAPGEIAGCLPFLDAVAASPGARVLITGLGLGVVPRWLLHHAQPDRADVVEIDPDVITLVAGDQCAAEDWASDPRFHVHHGDAHTWRPPRRPGCALHPGCVPPLRYGWAPPFDATWHDIYDTVDAANLPSMHRLHRRYARWCRWQMSWERAECEAMRARHRARAGGRGCMFVSDTGYPTEDP